MRFVLLSSFITLVVCSLFLVSCIKEEEGASGSQSATSTTGTTTQFSLSGPSKVNVGKSITITGANGTAPYSFSVSAGSAVLATINTTSASLTAPLQLGQVTVLAKDANEKEATLKVQIVSELTKSPNDFYFSFQNNYLKSIESWGAWNFQTDCRSVLVGVIDSGIDLTHSDLASNIYTNTNETAANSIDEDSNGFVDDIHGWNFVNDNNNVAPPSALEPHGTHVAGIIGAVGNNGPSGTSGITGICWQAKIIPLKALAYDASLGGEVGATSDIIDAMNYGVTMGVKVFNGSFGGGGNNATFKTAIESAETAGALFVVAAGNEATNNDTSPRYPASYPVGNIVTVAALKGNGYIASFSNFGSTSVHIGAPGEKIRSTIPFGQYIDFDGTSMATPIVAGSAALLWSYKPALTLGQLKDRILASAEALPQLSGKVQNSRRINIKRALLY